MPVAALTEKYDPRIGQLAEELLAFLRRELPGIQEETDIPANMIALSYSSGYKGMICTVIFSKKELKLGFYKGAELPDPAGLLGGTGKVHRYAVIRESEDIDTPALRNLLTGAVEAYHKRMNP